MEYGFNGPLSFFMVVILVVALGAGIAYGSLRWRQWRKHPVAAKERDQATREAYGRREG